LPGDGNPLVDVPLKRSFSPEQQQGAVATVKLVQEESLNAWTCYNNSLQEQANIARALVQT
jgi:hypothetical protein